MFFHKRAVFLREKSTRQGCTKPKTELGMHQNLHFQQNPLKIKENPKINPPSTITILTNRSAIPIPNQGTIFRKFEKRALIGYGYCL